MPKAQERVRVIQWATGRSGIPALRSIIGRPDIELVGVHVSSAAKDGVDAGELCGLPATGVTATRDAAALLAGPGDIVCYTATDVGRLDEVIDDLCAILETGKDVVTITPTQLFHIPTADQKMVSRLREACARGGSSLHFTGIYPGFFADALLLNLSSLSHAIESVTMAEMLPMSSYDPEMLKAMGFGSDRDSEAAHAALEVLNFYGESMLRYLAQVFELTYDEIRYSHEVATADEAFTTISGLAIPKDSIAGVHSRMEGVIDGHRRVCAEYYERLDSAIAPQWPQPPDRGGYRFTIIGEPDLTVEVAFHGDDPLTDASAITSNRAVHLLAAVHAAPPGIVERFTDLPFRPGRMG